jgi:hypothetical protein
MNAIFDMAKAGDVDELFVEENFTEWFEDSTEVTNDLLDKIKTVDVKGYKRTHVLISFSPEKMIYLRKYLEEILKMEGVEYEQSNN